MEDLCAVFKTVLLQTQVQASKWLSTGRENCFWEHFQKAKNSLFFGAVIINFMHLLFSNTYLD